MPRVLRTLIHARNQLDAVTSIARARCPKKLNMSSSITLLSVLVNQVIFQVDVFSGVSAFLVVIARTGPKPWTLQAGE